MSAQAKFEIVSPGNRLTVQDLGRRGSQRFGVSVSGVLDLRAAVTANRLVGNPVTSALLESTFGGTSLLFAQDTKVAVTGAAVNVDIDRFPMPTWETMIAPAESLLSVSVPLSGLYSYIAVEGGIDVPEVLGSRSTHVASGLGGFLGRTLSEGDGLLLGSESASGSRPRAGTAAASDVVSASKDDGRRIRVIAGPQFDAFDDTAKATFFGSSFSVSNLTDRQGARLEGAEVPAIGGKHDIVSDPAYMGAVQIPADGKPIVLLADRQPTGGYAKIASVISADLPTVVQKTPGSEISFELVDITVAQELSAEFRRSIYEQSLQESDRTRTSTVVVSGESYNVELVLPQTAEFEEYDEGIVYASIDGGPELAAKFEASVNE